MFRNGVFLGLLVVPWVARGPFCDGQKMVTPPTERLKNGSSKGANVRTTPVSERQQLNILRKISISEIPGENCSEVGDVDRTNTNNLEKRNRRGETPLHVACIHGDYDQARALIEDGAQVRTQDNAGWTPLHEACNRGWYKVARLLIATGADLNARAPLNGFTPLHDAAVNSHPRVVRLLLRYGADAQAVTEDGRTALDLATDPKVVDAIKRPLQINEPTDETWSATSESISEYILPEEVSDPVFAKATNSTSAGHARDANVSMSSALQAYTKESATALQKWLNVEESFPTTCSRNKFNHIEETAAGVAYCRAQATKPFKAICGPEPDLRTSDSWYQAPIVSATKTKAKIRVQKTETDWSDIKRLRHSEMPSHNAHESANSSGVGASQDVVTGSGTGGSAHLGNGTLQHQHGCRSSAIEADNSEGAGSDSSKILGGVSSSSSQASGSQVNTLLKSGVVTGDHRAGCSEDVESMDSTTAIADTSGGKVSHSTSSGSSGGGGKKRRKSVDKESKDVTHSPATAIDSQQLQVSRAERSERAKSDLLKGAARSPRPKKQKGRSSNKDDKNSGSAGITGISSCVVDKSLASGTLIGSSSSAVSDVANGAEITSTGLNSLTGSVRAAVDLSNVVGNSATGPSSSVAGGSNKGAGDRVSPGDVRASGIEKLSLVAASVEKSTEKLVMGGHDRDRTSSSATSGVLETSEKCGIGSNIARSGGLETATGKGGAAADKGTLGTAAGDRNVGFAGTLSGTGSANAAAAGDHENNIDKDSITTSGDGLKVPPLKIVLPPMSSEKENSNDAPSAPTSKTKQLPYIVNSPLAGNSPQPASPAASSPLEARESREESKRVTRSSQRAQLHDNNDNDDDTPLPSSGKTHPRKRKIRNPRGAAAASSQRESTRSGGTTAGGAQSCSNLTVVSTETRPNVSNGDKSSVVPGNDEEIPELPTSVPEKDYFGEPSTMFNPYEALKNIRLAVDKRRQAQIRAHISLKLPVSFKDYLLNKCTYALEGNPHSHNHVATSSLPDGLPVELQDLFVEQERERHKLRLQQLKEREKLVLTAEQEIMRIHAQQARAQAGQAIPLSATAVLRDQEIYNTLDPESNLYNPRTGMTAANPLLDNDVKDPTRYNGRLFASWLQDTDDKWERNKEAMLSRHHNEAEALRAVQMMDWEWKAKQTALNAAEDESSKASTKLMSHKASGISGSAIKGNKTSTTSHKHADGPDVVNGDQKPSLPLKIFDLNICVPMIHVPEDFEIFPS